MPEAASTPPKGVAEKIKNIQYVASPDQLAVLQKLIGEARVLDQRIENGEALLRSLKTERDKYLMSTIPDKMVEMKVPSLTIAGSGNEPPYVATNKPFYKAGISREWPEERQYEGYEYLKAIGHGDLIKQEVTYLFPVGTDPRLIEEFINKTLKLKVQIQKKGRRGKKARPITLEVPYPTTREGVHSGTLTAWLKRLVESKDKIVPKLNLEKIGGYIGRKVELKTVKQKGE